MAQGHGQGPKFQLDVEGELKPWDKDTITTEEIIALGGWDASQGAIVIDIGINTIQETDGSVTLVGDVDTASVEPVVEAVSPVPGGVGPLTDIWVLRNTVTAAWLQTQPAGILGRLDLSTLPPLTGAQ